MKNILKLKNRIASLIIIFASIIFGWVYADDYVVEDLNYYHKAEWYAPTIKQSESPGFLELHIAPANAQGVSLNKLKILDTSRLKGLLIVNRTDDEYIEGIGHVGPNKNLEHSLTADPCAQTIIIEVAYGFPTADTYLQGLIRIVGKRVDVVIKSATAVSINNAFFHNMNKLKIQSEDSRHYNDCTSTPCARNIRVNSGGIEADCPVFFYSYHTVIDGPIRMGTYDLTLKVESACLFKENAKVYSLKALKANCQDTFLNRGNLKIKGSFYVDTGSFINEPDWYKAPWTQEMINRLDPYARNPYFTFGMSHAVPYDDIDGRQYDAKKAGTGFIQAHDFVINARNGDIINRFGGEIRDTGGKDAKSYIMAKGKILNQYRKCATEDGYFRGGFRIERSTLFFSGNALIHSDINSIITDASTFIVKGDALMEAGEDIKSLGFTGRYLVNYVYHYDGIGARYEGQVGYEGQPLSLYPDGRLHIDQFKDHHGGMPEKGLVQYHCSHNDNDRTKCVERTQKGHDAAYYEGIQVFFMEAPIDGPERYHEVIVPSISFIEGNVRQVAQRDIIQEQSIILVGKNADFIAGGRYILEGVKIKGPPQEQFVQEVKNAISHGKDGYDVAMQYLDVALVSQNRQSSFAEGGATLVRGTLNIAAKEEIKIASATLYGKEAVNLVTEGPINIHGSVEPYVKHVNDDPTNLKIEHGFIPHNGFVGSDGNTNMQAAEVFITGATVDSQGNTTIIAGTLSSEPVTASATDLAYDYKSHTFSETSVTTRKTVSHTLLPMLHTVDTLNVIVDKLKCEGCYIYAKNAFNAFANIITFKAHEVPQFFVQNTKHSGVQVPGIVKALMAAAHGEPVWPEIPLARAIHEVSKMDSPSDLKPLIEFLAQSYEKLDSVAKNYEATHSLGSATKDVVLDQLGLTIGYGKTKTHYEKSWTDWFAAYVRSGNIRMWTKDALIQGVIFEADKAFHMNVTNNLKFLSQELKGSESSTQKSHSFMISYNGGDTVGISGSRQIAKLSSESVQHILSKVAAGETVTFDVGGNAEIEGTINAPKIKMEVSGTLALRTVQNIAEGSTSQNSQNAGISFSPSKGLTLSGGFHQGAGDSYKRWASEQTTIAGDEVEIKVKELILEAAQILGKSGYVDTETITYVNLENIDENHFSSFGLDTNFVKFIIQPENGRQILSTANAIKGMVAMSNEDENMLGVLRATISKNLKVKTQGAINDLNRDESQAQEILEKSSHHFSLAIPIVDWKQLGEDLNRIGTTAKEINQKMQGTFNSAKQKASTPEEKINIEVQEKLIGDFYETLEENKLLNNLEKGEAFKDFVEAAISKECRDFIAVFNAKEQIIGQKPIEEASAQELLFLAQAISKSTELLPADKTNVDNEQNNRLLENYTAELAEYGIDIEAPETFEKAKHLPTTLVGKMIDQVGNKIIQIEKGFDEIASMLFKKIKDKPEVLLFWEMQHYLQHFHYRLSEKAFKTVGKKVGEKSLTFAEYLLGKEAVAKAEEYVFKGLEYVDKTFEYIVDHSTKGQRKFVGTSVDGASIFIPLLKSKTLIAAAMIGLKKELKPDIGDGVEALARAGVKKEVKKEGILKASAGETCPKEIGLIDKSNVKPHINAENLGKKGTVSTKLEGEILKAGKKAGGGFKHCIDIDANLLKRKINFSDDLNNSKLRRKFHKHGKHFGMEGKNFNKENAELFKQNIRDHINNPDTIPIAGKYTTGNVGDVVHYYNPKTELNVIKDMNGNYVSGWKLSEEQQEFLKLKSQIGGQKK